MKKRRLTVLAILLVLIPAVLFTTGAKADHDSEVKAAITGYIEAKTVDGAYYVDGVATRFDYVHPGGSKKGALYVQCADFNRGNIVFDVDYYLLKEGGLFTVVKEVLHKRDGRKVNKVLWQKR